MRVQVNVKRNPDEVDCHVLPCKVHHTGTATVSQHFHISESKDAKIAYFRGRHLKGRDVSLPANYTGYVMKETAAPAQLRQQNEDDSEDDDGGEERVETRHLEGSHTFNKITVWGHEQVATDDDPWVAGVKDWIPLAKLIHE